MTGITRQPLDHAHIVGILRPPIKVRDSTMSVNSILRTSFAKSDTELLSMVSITILMDL